jgi:chromosome segregation ATPase
LKERVRSDIRKIRVREKELENRLEIVRKDSEALIGSRENKIIELKRKLDLLEFNMDLLQDQYAREKESTFKLRERLAKAAQVVRMAGGMLDPLTGEPTGESGREAS